MTSEDTTTDSNRPSIYTSVARLQKALERIHFLWEHQADLQNQKKAKLAQDIKELIDDYYGIIQSLPQKSSSKK